MYMSLYNNSPLAAANHNFTLKKKKLLKIFMQLSSHWLIAGTLIHV